MPAVGKKLDSMLFWGDRVLLCNLDDLNVAQLQLVAARRAVIFAYFSTHGERRFLCQQIEFRKRLVGNMSLHHDTLNNAASIAQQEKANLPARSLVVEPALEGYLLPLVVFEVFNVGVVPRHANESKMLEKTALNIPNGKLRFKQKRCENGYAIQSELLLSTVVREELPQDGTWSRCSTLAEQDEAPRSSTFVLETTRR